jgi:hypothetical protein
MSNFFGASGGTRQWTLKMPRSSSLTRKEDRALPPSQSDGKLTIHH